LRRKSKEEKRRFYVQKTATGQRDDRFRVSCKEEGDRKEKNLKGRSNGLPFPISEKRNCRGSSVRPKRRVYKEIGGNCLARVELKLKRVKGLKKGRVFEKKSGVTKSPVGGGRDRAREKLRTKKSKQETPERELGSKKKLRRMS